MTSLPTNNPMGDSALLMGENPIVAALKQIAGQQQQFMPDQTTGLPPYLATTPQGPIPPETIVPVQHPTEQQISPYDMAAIDELMHAHAPQKEKSWSDTGKELMAPLAVGLLKSLVHSRYGGFLGGLREGIDTGVGLWQHQRDQAAASQAAAQRNAAARAAVFAKMGQAQATERLRQAQLEQTGELTRERIGAQREGIQSREQMHAETVAMQAANAAQASADRRFAQEQENRRAQEHNDVMQQIAAMRQGPGGLKDKYVSGTFTTPLGQSNNMKASDLDNPQKLYERDAATLKGLGETEKAKAVMDPTVQPLLYQKKSTKDLDNETALINANATLKGLDRQVKAVIPKEDNPEAAQAFVAGKHEGMFGGKPLEYQDISPEDSPATQAAKQQANEIAKRGYIRRYIDYLKYTHSATDEGKTAAQLNDLLNNVGIARQQAASAAMALTGSRAFGQQMTFFGAHIPNYTDPPSLMMDKIKNLQSSYNRALFQAGRWNAISKDQFGPTYNRYLQDQGATEGKQETPTTAPASAFHD